MTRQETGYFAYYHVLSFQNGDVNKFPYRYLSCFNHLTQWGQTFSEISFLGILDFKICLLNHKKSRNITGQNISPIFKIKDKLKVFCTEIFRPFFSFIISFKVAEDLSTKVYVFRERLGVSEPELCEQHSISRFTANWAVQQHTSWVIAPCTALCVQMDFTRTFEANTKCNNIKYVWSHFYQILVVLKYHRRLWNNIFDTDIFRCINTNIKGVYLAIFGIFVLLEMSLS